MPTKYLIATHPLPGIAASEAASVVTRALRSADRKLKSEHVLQLPLLDGGEGTLEHLVTLTLGSFLEVEATDGSGEQAIIPFGLLGEENAVAFISIRSLAAMPQPDEASKKRRKLAGVATTGTTYGVGELMRDALDENARTILLGWEEPLARDAGLGIAAALGVKFFDKDDKRLDLSKWDRELFSKIHRLDGTGRGMEVLMSKVILLRSEGIRNTSSDSQASLEDSLFESELTRLAEIVKRDCGKDVNVSRVQFSGSAVEFGLQAFFDCTIEEGGPYVMQAANVLQTIEDENPKVVIVAETLEQVYGVRSPLASQQLLKWIKSSELPFDLYLQETPIAAALSRFRRGYRSLDRFDLLKNAKLFLAPHAQSPEEEVQNNILRLEKLVQDSVTARGAEVTA